MTDLAAEFDCNLIALTLSKDTGIPKTSDGRLEIAFEIYEKCMEKGIDSSKIYFDPLILPVNVEQSQAMEAVNTIQMIKESFDPPVKTVIGLSNISNGSPKELRPLINRVFAVLAFGAGLDAAIIDAKDLELVRILRMIENNKPESTTDELYINLSNMIKDFSDIENISYDKNNEEQSAIIKTVNILTGKKSILTALHKSNFLLIYCYIQGVIIINKRLIISALLLCTTALPGYTAMTPQANILYQQACTLEYQKDLQGAVNKILEAIKLNGDDPMLYTKLAGIYTDMDKLEEAISAYEKLYNYVLMMPLYISASAVFTKLSVNIRKHLRHTQMLLEFSLNTSSIT